ncbi:MAG: hydrogen peroxide resistance inhibitor IprA, partial [Enterobacter kobei]|nr:hydrogen peroxide resistance inhibitor IprA [Enterobacter kobei]
IALERQNNPLLLGVVASPGIVGLGVGAMPTQEQYHLHVETACRGYHLPASTTLQLLEKHQLWRDAFYWMTWQHRALEARDRQLIGTSSYTQIRATLLTMAKWDDVLRARIGVMAYIQRRTLISRSVIAEVLAALRQGDYIRARLLMRQCCSGCRNNLRLVTAQLADQVIDAVTHIHETRQR